MFKTILGIFFLIIFSASLTFAGNGCSYKKQQFIRNSTDAAVIKDRVIYGNCGYQAYDRSEVKSYTRFEREYIQHDPATDYNLMSSDGRWY